MNFKKNNGITLITLIITVIIMLILASVFITFGVKNLSDISNNSKKSIDISTIKNAVQIRYINYHEEHETKTKNFKFELLGIPIADESGNEINSNEKSETSYYKLYPEDLKNLNLEGTFSENYYIVNYNKNEVFSPSEFKNIFPNLNF